MTGPLGNSEFCFSRISMFPSTSSRETLRFSGNKIHCSPRDQSLSVKCELITHSLASQLSPYREFSEYGIFRENYGDTGLLLEGRINPWDIRYLEEMSQNIE